MTALLVGTLVAQACGGSDDASPGGDDPSGAAPADQTGEPDAGQDGTAVSSVTVGEIIVQFVPEICSIRDDGEAIDIAGSGSTLDGSPVFVSLSRQQDRGVDIALGSIDIGRESLTTPADPAQPSFRVLRPDGQEGGGAASFDFDQATGTFSGNATVRDDNGIATSSSETLPVSWTAAC